LKTRIKLVLKVLVFIISVIISLAIGCVGFLFGVPPVVGGIILRYPYWVLTGRNIFDDGRSFMLPCHRTMEYGENFLKARTNGLP
jgi:hypothetical protein